MPLDQSPKKESFEEKTKEMQERQAKRAQELQQLLARQAQKPKEEWPKIHKVKKGDTMSEISFKYYGDATRYKRIHKANKALMGDEPKLRPGWELVIPEPLERWKKQK